MKLCHLLLLALSPCTLPALSFALEDGSASKAQNMITPPSMAIFTV